jgi:benzoyl-CoA reductase/2-hydroxyglutaryl-CoA dehydratase subunit BcrC/BadD/HgdB
MAKEKIDKKVGYSCSYVPLEILDSFGIKADYVIGDDSSADISQGYLNANICGFCKDICSRPRDQVYDMIFTDCCDAMVKVHEAFKLHPAFKDDFSFLLTVPRSFDEIDIEFYPNVLKHFISTLETATGKKFSEDRLAGSIGKYNQLRRRLKQVEKMLLENRIWGSEYVKLIFSLYNTGVDKSIELAGQFIQTHQDDKEKDVEWGVMLTGSNMPAALSLAEHLEKYDANARYFDTCNLARFYNMEVSESLPPLEAISRAYLTKAPCPRMKDSHVRMQKLIKIFKEYELDVAVYHTVKFCATHIFDYMAFKKLCAKEDVPLIRIETDHDFDLPGQMQTRLEASLEML